MELLRPLLFLVISLASFTSPSSASRVFSNIPDYSDQEVEDVDVSRIASTITVAKSGQAHFSTVQAAIDSIPSQNNRWVLVLIFPGIYVEKVSIPVDKPYIYLKGANGRMQTTIVFGDHDRTDTSATFTSSPDNVMVEGITFENSFNVASAPKSFDEMSFVEDELENREDMLVIPAVAARIYGDKSAFFECGFIGLQDTLFDVQGRHYFRRCYIEGAIDFIFGGGQSFYENTMINVTVGTIASLISVGYITAQGGASSLDTSGFVFEGGWVFGSGQALLGRAYGPNSRVIFSGTKLGAVVAPQGWDAWRYKGHEGNLMYAEVNCQGRGANTSKRVPWEKSMSSSDLDKYYSKASFVDQDMWISKLPQSGKIFK